MFIQRPVIALLATLVIVASALPVGLQPSFRRGNDEVSDDDYVLSMGGSNPAVRNSLLTICAQRLKATLLAIDLGPCSGGSRLMLVSYFSEVVRFRICLTDHLYRPSVTPITAMFTSAVPSES